jgi:hypothetical protein
MIDLGIDHDLQWVCFIVATGECWTYQNKDIRLVDNETMGRRNQACRDVAQAIRKSSQVLGNGGAGCQQPTDVAPKSLWCPDVKPPR